MAFDLNLAKKAFDEVCDQEIDKLKNKVKDAQTETAKKQYENAMQAFEDAKNKGLVPSK